MKSHVFSVWLLISYSAVDTKEFVIHIRYVDRYIDGICKLQGFSCETNL